MARSKIEVLVGTGTLYVAPVGEVMPAVDSAPAGNWADIGYSEDGWALAADFSVEDVPVAEVLDPLYVLKTGQNVRLVGAAAQASDTNLQLAFSGGTVTADAGPPATSTFEPPATDSYTAKALLLRIPNGPYGATLPRQYQLYEAVNVGAFEIRHGPAPDKTLIAMEWRLLIPSNGTDPLFEVVDQTA